MGEIELLSFTGPDELAAGAARRWIEALTPSTGRVPPRPHLPCVALSGGRIAARFLAALAQCRGPARQPLNSVQFFWSDERCVPPDHPESNYGLAQELLLEPLDIPAESIHRIHGEDPPDLAASQAEIELRRLAPLDGDSRPILDLILLGMGEDGHVASLFPGEPERFVSDPAAYRPVAAPKPPPTRITLGYQAIFAAREVWVLVSGAGKAAALRESLSPGGGTPLARVIRSRERTRIFADIAPAIGGGEIDKHGLP